MKSICEQIYCPWFSKSTDRSYGCQRWGSAAFCHLNQSHPGVLGDNEYALYPSKMENGKLKTWAISEEDIAKLQAENNRFCLEDPKYSEDRQFAIDHPDWFEDGAGFIPSEIVEAISR